MNNEKQLRQKQFADFLINLLNKYQWTQKQLATAIQCKPQYIWNITTGGAIPREENFDKILMILKPVLSEEDYNRLIVLHRNAQYGAQLGVEIMGNSESDIVKKHFVEIFDELSSNDKLDVLKLMLEKKNAAIQ